MTRLLLILVMFIQLSGCASFFWQTLGGTVIGNIAAEAVKDKIDKHAEDKKVKP
jgi:uncharacterized protein YceK